MYTRTFRTHLIWTSLLLAACGTGSDGLDPHTSVNGKLPGLGDGEIGEPGGDAAGFLTDGGAPFEGAAIPTAAPVEDTGDGMSVGSGDAGGFGGGGGSDSDSALAPTASEPSGPSTRSLAVISR